MASILSLPDELLDLILTYISYDEVTRCRLVCKYFDAAGQRVLNRGFHKVEKYHSKCFRQIKAKLPRRDSERRKHPLAYHCDILQNVENRISLLNTTFMKYVFPGYCCFFPGKILDEILRIIRIVTTTPDLQRNQNFLQELRDMSAMAQEFFEEKFAPAFRARSCPKKLYANYPSYSVDYSVDPLKIFSEPAFAELKQNAKKNEDKCTELIKENGELKQELADLEKQLEKNIAFAEELNKIILQQEVLVSTQATRIEVLEGKKKKLIERTNCTKHFIKQFEEEIAKNKYAAVAGTSSRGVSTSQKKAVKRLTSLGNPVAAKKRSVEGNMVL